MKRTAEIGIECDHCYNRGVTILCSKHDVSDKYYKLLDEVKQVCSWVSDSRLNVLREMIENE